VKPIRLTPSSGGWLYADWGEGKAWVRLDKDRLNRLTRIAELHVLKPTPERLRRIPLPRIEAAATMRGAGLVQLLLAAGINDAPPDLSKPPPEGSLDLTRRYRLKRPSGKRLDDGFYQDVAHAYQSAVAFGLRPRRAIVDDTGAADATVAGWVLKARKLGYLPRAQAGRVSA